MALPHHLSDPGAHKEKFDELQETIERNALQLATNEEAEEATGTTKAVNPAGVAAAAAGGNLTFRSSGNAASTGFQLANGTDLAEIFDSTPEIGVENATSGSGAFVSGVALSKNGAKIKMTQTLRGAAYCSYCTYCTYCQCQCDCSCDG